jgi:hemerythrin-like domain-containing protein
MGSEGFLMDDASTREMTDTRDMVVVHTALLRELRLAPRLVDRATKGDARSVTRVAEHLNFLLDLLAHHHEGEDRLLWPTLRARVPDALAGVIARMEGQHADVDELNQAVRRALGLWRSDPGSGTELAALLRRLHAVVEEHLNAEEQEVLPLAALHLTDAEWREIGEAGVASIAKAKLPMVFGMLMYEGDPAVLRTMLASAPAVPRTVVPRIAPWVYARYARRIHGTSRP